MTGLGKVRQGKPPRGRACPGSVSHGGAGLDLGLHRQRLDGWAEGLAGKGSASVGPFHIPGWADGDPAGFWSLCAEVRFLHPEQGHLYNADVTEWGDGCIRCGTKQGLRKVRLHLFASVVKCALVCLPCQTHLNEIITNLRDGQPAG